MWRLHRSLFATFNVQTAKLYLNADFMSHFPHPNNYITITDDEPLYIIFMGPSRTNPLFQLCLLKMILDIDNNYILSVCKFVWSWYKIILYNGPFNLYYEQMGPIFEP